MTDKPCRTDRDFALQLIREAGQLALALSQDLGKHELGLVAAVISRDLARAEQLLEE